MSEDYLSDLIKKSFEHYDKQNEKYKTYMKYHETRLDYRQKKFIFKNDKIKVEYNGEVLGIFDSLTKVWIWGWMFPSSVTGSTELSKNLLNYGLKLQPSDKDEYAFLYIKTLLINSRILLKDKLQLDIQLALSSYLIKDNALFIYPVKKYLDKNKSRYLTTYYIIY